MYLYDCEDDGDAAWRCEDCRRSAWPFGLPRTHYGVFVDVEDVVFHTFARLSSLLITPLLSCSSHDFTNQILAFPLVELCL